MKKRLLLFMCAIMAICAIFAISVSAEVTIYDNAPAKSVIQTQTSDVVVFDDGFSCLSAYIVKDQETLVVDLSFIIEQTKKTYTMDDIVSLDIPEGITTISQYYFSTEKSGNLTKDANSIIRCTIPATVTSIGKCAFQKCTNIQQIVFEHTENSELKTIGSFLVQGCTNLTALCLPDCVETIQGDYQFSYCPNLTAFYLPKNLKTFKAETSNQGVPFYNNSRMYFVNEPFTYDNIPEKPDVYYMPSGLTTLSGEIFRCATNLNETIVIGAGVTKITSAWFFNGTAGTSNLVFLGDMEEIRVGSGSYKFIWPVNRVIFANKNDTSTASFTTFEGTDSDGKFFFCASEADKTKHLESPRHSEITPATCYSNQKGVVRCFCNLEIDRGEFENTMLPHSYIDDLNCTTANYCKNYNEEENVGCKAVLAADAEAHIEAHDVIYANGFTSAGVHNTYCSNATCKALDEVENLSAMFVHEGYSYKDGVLGGIDTKFRINTDALKLYELYEGTLHFGIMIANSAHFANVDVFIKDGKLTSTNSEGKNSGVIVEMTSREYDYFNCHIDGFDFTDSRYTNLGLIIAGYVYGEDPTDITYIQKDYQTDDDQTTLETPYVDTITKDKEVKIVNIVAVKEFEPLIENQQ